MKDRITNIFDNCFMSDAYLYANRLRAALDFRKMSQMELSRQTGLSYTTINTMYQGRGLPNGYSLMKIATALNVSADYLLGLSDVMERR